MAKSRRIRNNKNLKRTSGGARHTRRQRGGVDVTSVKDLKTINPGDLKALIKTFKAPLNDENPTIEFYGGGAAGGPGLGLTQFLTSHRGKTITLVASVVGPGGGGGDGAPTTAKEHIQRLSEELAKKDKGTVKTRADVEAVVADSNAKYPAVNVELKPDNAGDASNDDVEAAGREEGAAERVNKFKALFSD